MKSKCEIDQYGDKRWFNSKGLLHRENGHAIEWANGSKMWYIHGQLHREDGAAIELSDGYKEWWIHGKAQEPLTENIKPIIKEILAPIITKRYIELD